MAIFVNAAVTNVSSHSNIDTSSEEQRQSSGLGFPNIVAVALAATIFTSITLGVLLAKCRMRMRKQGTNSQPGWPELASYSRPECPELAGNPRFEVETNEASHELDARRPSPQQYELDARQTERPVPEIASYGYDLGVRPPVDARGNGGSDYHGCQNEPSTIRPYFDLQRYPVSPPNGGGQDDPATMSGVTVPARETRCIEGLRSQYKLRSVKPPQLTFPPRQSIELGEMEPSADELSQLIEEQTRLEERQAEVRARILSVVQTRSGTRGLADDNGIPP